MTNFDAVQYKRTTEQQWQDAAEAWHRWGPALNAWLGPATELMLDLAGIGPGSRVLDIAAGAGEQTIVAAKRVGASGSVLATDISANILRCAEGEARRNGLANVTCRRMDGEALDVPEASFDAVISRVGLIYFPDRQKALAGMKRALKAGGRVATLVYSLPERNPFFSVPIGIIRRRAGLAPPPPGQPGPFSLGGPGVLESALLEAGFHDVTVTAVQAPVRMATSAECVRFEQEAFGALHQMLAGLDAGGQAAAWEEIAHALAAFDGPHGFEGPCEMLLGAGAR